MVPPLSKISVLLRAEVHKPYPLLLSMVPPLIVNLDVPLEAIETPSLLQFLISAESLMIKVQVFPESGYIFTPAPSGAVQFSIAPPVMLKVPSLMYTPPPLMLAVKP